MNSVIHNEEYFKTKEQLGLKEYIFFTRSCYRHFFVLGKDLKDAGKNFMRINEIKRCGFSLDDLPIRLQYSDAVKNYSMEEIWDNNENKKVV